MTEREVFFARLASAKEDGLQDLKFMFQPTEPMGPDEIYRALNEVDDAIAETRTVHSGWLGNEPA